MMIPTFDHFASSYQVFDPITHTCSLDLNALAGSQVILIGEHHESWKMRRTQKVLLQSLCSISQIGQQCLLVEGKPLGYGIAANKFSRFRVPASMVILGSDSQCLYNEEELDLH